MKCPLCGYTFDEKAEGCRKGCPVQGKACEMICCPHCRYTFVETSATVRLLERMARKIRRGSR